MSSLKLFKRFAIIGGLIVLLMIPLLMIRATIAERTHYRDEAVNRVAESRAGAQTLTGPIMVIPWTRHYEVDAFTDDGKKIKEKKIEKGQYISFPETLNVKGNLKPDVRTIGLFKIPVYTLETTVNANFRKLVYPDNAELKFGKPYLSFGIHDVRGLIGSPQLTVDGVPVRITGSNLGIQAKLPAFTSQPLLKNTRTAQSGVTAGENVTTTNVGTTGSSQTAHILSQQAKSVTMTFKLDGTKSLSIVPLADDNKVQLQSAWQHPLFSGSFLPAERSISGSGFNAHWSISSLATNVQSALSEYPQTISDDIQTIRVDLVNPVDTYTQTERAAKYGILFIVLTFVGFALFELLKELRIHPLQYLLVGLALAIFFLLLLSLSEHISFWLAYLMSAAACIGLQTVYLSGVLGSIKHALKFSTVLTLLYGVLYVLLISEDNALLMGSILLFIILAGIMLMTRKLNWYELSERLR